MPSRSRWAAIALGLAALAALAALPFFQSQYQLLVYTRCLLLALMAQGWNFIGGYAGYPAFGNVGFFGIGAYATGLLMLSEWHVPFFAALAGGAVLAAAVAALIGLAVLRLKGHYFAIATLGVAEALREVADCWDSVTQGSTGIDLPLRDSGDLFYYTALGLVVAGLCVTVLLARSKLGYAWIAIREDADAARSLGINTTRAKVLAFTLSAVFAALAGGVTAYENIHVAPGDFFQIEYTLEMIICCVIGGAGTVFGPLLGAGIYQLLSTYAWQHFLELHPTVLGGIIVVFVVFAPRGLLGQRRFRPQDFLANVRSHRVT